LVHPEDQEAFTQESDRVRLTKEPFHLEYRLRKQDGTYIVVEDNGCFFADHTGKMTRMVGFIIDITERKRAEAEITNALQKERELSQLRSRFVTMVSHEIRTPLSTILSAAELLEHYEHRSTEAEKLELFRQIKAAIQRMISLLDNVLTVNRAELGNLEFNPTLLDLEKFCCDLVEELQLHIKTKHQISLVIQGECNPVYLDEKALWHIFTNLLSNAIKYSSPGSVIDFRVICQEDAAIFQVKDQGIGILSEDQQYLFESFHRGRNVGNVPGTGVGLSIVKRFVDLHKGRIMIKSTLGVGTTFTVTLPLK
jgi:signal transduction histidine kinase